VFLEDAMPVQCRCGEWFGLGDRHNGYACDDCGEVLCRECLPGSKDPRVCEACEEPGSNE
jgi:hypothetical protein